MGIYTLAGLGPVQDGKQTINVTNEIDGGAERVVGHVELMHGRLGALGYSITTWSASGRKIGLPGWFGSRDRAVEAFMRWINNEEEVQL